MDDDRWRRMQPPSTGPSAPQDLHFNPLASAIGVFAAIAVPVAVFAYARPADSTRILVFGIVVAAVVGVFAGLWVAHRGGRIWRGPQL
jgi:hypothetical protein